MSIDFKHPELQTTSALPSSPDTPAAFPVLQAQSDVRGSIRKTLHSVKEKMAFVAVGVIIIGVLILCAGSGYGERFWEWLKQLSNPPPDGSP